MFSLVSLLAAVALVSLYSVHTNAQIEGKLEMDNNLLPNVETLGPWSNNAKNFIQNITPRLIASTGDRRAGSFFAQRIGIAIQRGNAASILATIPRGHDLYNIPPPRRRVVQKYVKITSHPPETVRHMPGSALVLECEVMGNPAPMSGWMKNGIPISDFEEDVNEIFSPPTFSIARMTTKLVVRSPSNGDVYTCVATAGLRETSASTTVIVEGESDLLSPLIPTKPVITAFYNDIFQLMGTSVTLPCRVYSPTKAQVYWIDNNSKLIYGNSRVRVLSSGDLHIKAISWADMGSYTCSAKNAYGKDVAETFLYPVKP